MAYMISNVVLMTLHFCRYIHVNLLVFKIMSDAFKNRVKKQRCHVCWL